MQALLDDIKENGIQDSVKYVEYQGEKYIVDGHHRFFAASTLGIKSVPAEAVSLPYQGYKSVADLALDGKMPKYWPWLKR